MSRLSLQSAHAARRCFWLAMLASHAPALWSAAVGGADDPVRLVGLLASTAFFLLKLIDVPWLRFRAGWRTFVALSVVVALIHAGAFGVVPHGTFAPQLAAVLSSVVLLEPVQRRWNSLQLQLDRLRAGRRGKSSLPVPAAYIEQDHPWRPPRWLIACVAAPPRAPPFSL